MRITHLRLLGFKSFVEPAELLIEPGLTGVVGPNGCGKSNLLEALRWVMGETSYKNMRGAAMDDVIFSGTPRRPARNCAEVMITLDNSARQAPATFNDADSIQIVRRIERDRGSAYFINGKSVRARDVQLLFADAATGARSPSLVGQGQIGDLVSAKPSARRRILEDAAGISGLHSRRHEAELRLQAAETNLERLADLQGQLSAQAQNLKRQARQAKRYKDLSHKIREVEALLFHLDWVEVSEQVSDEELALSDASMHVGTLTREAAEAARLQTDSAAGLPKLRDEEAVAAAVLQRLLVEQDGLQKEGERVAQRERELETRRDQTLADRAREQEVIDSAAGRVADVAAEQNTLQLQLAGQRDAQSTTRDTLEAAAARLGDAEADLSRLTEATAALRAEHRQAEQRAAECERRAERLDQDAARLTERRSALEQEVGAGVSLTDLDAELAAAEQRLATAESGLANVEERLAASRQTTEERRKSESAAALKARELSTEVETLAALLRPAKDADWSGLIDHLRVEPGYERALGAALGEDLLAPETPDAPMSWTSVDDSTSSDPSLEPGIEPLSRFVEAPAVLARRLAQIGVVAAGDGDKLQTRLRCGQRLVSAEGDVWRWDGFRASHDAPMAAATRLAQRNRLTELENDALAATERAEGERARLEQAVADLEAAESAERAAKDDVQTARRSETEGRKKRDSLRQAMHARDQEFGALAAAEDRLAQDRQTLAEDREAATAWITGLDNLDTMDAALDTQHGQVKEARANYNTAQAAHDGVTRDAEIASARLDALAREGEGWTTRVESARGQIDTLSQRATDIEAELAELAERPGQLAERGQQILTAISTAEARRSAAADELAAAENALKERDRAAKQIEERLTEAREHKARIEARLESARERRGDLVRRIRDELDCAPQDCLALGGQESAEGLPEAQTLNGQLQRLRGERERLGGVNLRADDELSEVSTELDRMEAERQDLEQAIQRLRTAISNLNREGRKRLVEAFDEVNGHFGDLFGKLFGGGEAQLELVDSDDPLESGLEIIARPPGKKPQVITLLSGGEKALTALALIFAVFLTNPSPICVLDEVDAPLDDANVERFCNLMIDVGQSTDTRFLLITHHPMTMARMNRLFGVTMAERGVSKLVSVDLETAEQYRESA